MGVFLLSLSPSPSREFIQRARLCPGFLPEWEASTHRSSFTSRPRLVSRLPNGRWHSSLMRGGRGGPSPRTHSAATRRGEGRFESDKWRRVQITVQ